MFVQTYVDGPHLQARLAANISERVWDVTAHHPAELKHTKERISGCVIVGRHQSGHVRSQGSKVRRPEVTL